MTNKMKIGTCEVPVEEKELDQAILKFFPENPRTYSVISAYGEPTQDEIEDYMKSLDHVKKLAVGIERSGLMIPIMVIGGKNMALLEEFSALEILGGRFALAWVALWGWGRVAARPESPTVGDGAMSGCLPQWVSAVSSATASTNAPTAKSTFVKASEVKRPRHP